MTLRLLHPILRYDKSEWFHELTHGSKHFGEHAFNEIQVSKANWHSDDMVSLESNPKHLLGMTRNCELNCFDHSEQEHN